MAKAMKIEKAQVGPLAEVLQHASFNGSIVTFRRFGDLDPRIQVIEYDPRNWRRKARVRRRTTIGARGALTIKEENNGR
jgi:hypothetical protein